MTKNLSTLQNSFHNSLSPIDSRDLDLILKSLPSHAKPYLVGGCVRDLLLGMTPKDFDIEIHHITIDDFEYCMQKLGAHGVGKSFFIYKLGSFDIGLPRSESKTGDGHRGFSVQLESDLTKALRRRDFTMNAIMIDLQSFEIVDLFGGVKDIKNKTIRMVSSESFGEDSLRVLRAIQFAARFGFRIESQTLQLCAQIDIADLSNERIRVEFEKLFMANNLHFGLFYMIRTAVFMKLFGVQIDRASFFKIALLAQKALKKAECADKTGLFFYLVSCVLKLSSVQLHARISSKNSVVRMLSHQKRVPKNITDRFLIGIAINIPLVEWLGSYVADTKERAMRLGVWDNCFVSSVGASDAISAGMQGADIGKYLRVQRAIEIRLKF